MFLQGIEVFLTLLTCVFAQSTSTELSRKLLDEYSLARCNDGSTAAYYHQTSDLNSTSRVLLFLPDDPIGCTSVQECQQKCKREPESCTSPLETEVTMENGIWSQEPRQNPFANYFKVFLPSCSSDEFSGIRDASESTGQLIFHGRHIFSSMLRDLVANFAIDRAEEVVLVGTGSGSHGVARNCDFLADAIATVNTRTKVRCILDGSDSLIPYWIQSRKCTPDSDPASVFERQKFLWGREDDESCIANNKDTANSTELAYKCGLFSRFWQDVSTPFFVIGSQLAPKSFDKFTCGIDINDEDYGDYSVGWRQGTMALAEAFSVTKPEIGWFLANCDNLPFMLDQKYEDERRNVRVKSLDDSTVDLNVLQAINNWIKGLNSGFQAIDPFGVPNEACSQVKSEQLNLRPDVRGHVVEKEDIRRTNGPGRFIPRPRFLPPRELFPPSYDFVSRDFAAVDDIFDYDNLELGPEFDLATRLGGLPIPVDKLPDRPVIVKDPPVIRAPAVFVEDSPTKAHPRAHPKVPVFHSPHQKARLWKKLRYLEYLRWNYARHYDEYYREYYGTGLPLSKSRRPSYQYRHHNKKY